MNNPLISVVVPVYKVEKYLSKCIESIIGQTYKNIEILLIDDGSPDSCPQICDEYAKKDNRIKVIHKTNGGLSDARNRGIKEASGEYLSFIDSDDYVDKDMIKYLYSLIDKYSADISICGFNRVTNETIIKDRCYENEVVFDSKKALQELAINDNMSDHAWNKLFKKELFINNKIEFPVGKIMEDIATTYRLFEVSNIIIAGNRCLYNYLIREDSIIGSKGINYSKNYYENVKTRYNHFKDDSELGFYYYKNYFYVVMRLFIEDNETISFLINNRILDNVINEGKNNGYYSRLPKVDKMRVVLLRINKHIYRKIMLYRRTRIMKRRGLKL